MPNTTARLQQSSPLAIRPTPNSATANLDHPTTTTAPTTSTVTMSSSTATSANAQQQAHTTPKARRQSTAEALAASADLEEALVSPTTGTTAEHHRRRDSLDGEAAERARTAAEAWKPAMDRRQSWNREEQKHSLQMSSIADVKTGPGFSERGAAQ
ncbi:hypothetical protein RB598_004286 [Gaeumannomyces tritici]